MERIISTEDQDDSPVLIELDDREFFIGSIEDAVSAAKYEILRRPSRANEIRKQIEFLERSLHRG